MQFIVSLYRNMCGGNAQYSGILDRNKKLHNLHKK